MATIAKLLDDGLLEKIDVELDGRDQLWRQLIATPKFCTWVQEDLVKLESSTGAEISPLEQVDALFATFISGKQLNHGRQFKKLNPGQKGVWELKTIDVRIFGWFAAKDCFVCVFGALADHVKDRKLYGGFRDQVVWTRDHLNLDKLKFVDSESEEDVISNSP